MMDLAKGIALFFFIALFVAVLARYVSLFSGVLCGLAGVCILLLLWLRERCGTGLVRRLLQKFLGWVYQKARPSEIDVVEKVFLAKTAPEAYKALLEARKYIEDNPAVGPWVVSAIHDRARPDMHSHPAIREAYSTFRSWVVSASAAKPELFPPLLQTVSDLLRNPNPDVVGHAITELGSLAELADRPDCNIPPAWKNLCFELLKKQLIAAMDGREKGKDARLIEYVARMRTNPDALSTTFSEVVRRSLNEHNEVYNEYIDPILRCLDVLGVDAVKLPPPALQSLQKCQIFCQRREFGTIERPNRKLFAPYCPTNVSGRIWRRVGDSVDVQNRGKMKLAISCTPASKDSCPNGGTCSGEEVSLGGISTPSCTLEPRVSTNGMKLAVAVAGESPVDLEVPQVEVVRRWGSSDVSAGTPGRSIRFLHRQGEKHTQKLAEFVIKHV
jgi:hypothetical protein